MKVLLVNGSPNRDGCTHTALSLVGGELEAAGIRTEEFWVGNGPIRDCIGCCRCQELQHCVFDDDKTNEFAERAKDFDGFVFGSPVFYAGMTGSLRCLLDRAFFSALQGSRDGFAFKPAACVVSARRAGTTAALEQMQKYLQHAQMPQVPSSYWPMVHGMRPEEVMEDREGVAIMHTLGRNMAWMMRCMEAGRAAGVDMPQPISRR